MNFAIKKLSSHYREPLLTLLVVAFGIALYVTKPVWIGEIRKKSEQDFFEASNKALSARIAENYIVVIRESEDAISNINWRVNDKDRFAAAQIYHLLAEAKFKTGERETANTIWNELFEDTAKIIPIEKRMDYAEFFEQAATLNEQAGNKNVVTSFCDKAYFSLIPLFNFDFISPKYTKNIDPKEVARKKEKYEKCKKENSLE